MLRVLCRFIAGLFLLLLICCTDKRLPEHERDFAFKDTSAITQIRITDKNGSCSNLQRTVKGWIVNGLYSCRSEAILNIMEVIKRIDVKSPVSSETAPTILKSMSTSALKVELLCASKTVRVFYVGFETDDGEGNYMLLENTAKGSNFEKPFICFIPGFKGYLRPRYIADPQEWRDRMVINSNPEILKSIKVHYIDAAYADSSFDIELHSTTQFTLRNVMGKSLVYNNEAMRQYLKYFMNINYERLITSKNIKREDSLKHSKPFVEVRVTDKTQQCKTFLFYRAPFTGKDNLEMGIHYTYDPDRCYLNFENGKEWAIVQYFVFGKWMVSPLYFLHPVQN